MVRLRLFTFSVRLAGLAALTCAGCGGDDDDDGAVVDASGDGGAIDAGEQPDAAPAVTRTGIIAVAETTISNPLPNSPVQGATVSISYIDDQSVTVPPLPGFDINPPIGQCLITRFDLKAGDRPPTTLGEGEVIITGTANGEFSCQYSDAADDYICQSSNGFIRGGVAGNAAMATVNVNGSFDLIGASFSAEVQGMQIQLTGFGAADGTYPIVEFIDEDTLFLGDEVPVSAVGGDDATFTTFVGAGPLPTIPKRPRFDFLDAGKAEVAIAKADSDVVPNFTVTAHARGDGFALSEESDLPHAFPSTARDVSYSCDDCGADPQAGTGQNNVMVISGETTDGDITKLSPLDMPPPVNAFATFTCISLADTVSITQAAVAEILAAGPTRVQVTVGRFVVATETAAGRATTNVALGHSVTGFTDIGPAAGR
jgi:hypothetical protein